MSVLIKFCINICLFPLCHEVLLPGILAKYDIWIWTDFWVITEVKIILLLPNNYLKADKLDEILCAYALFYISHSSSALIWSDTVPRTPHAGMWGWMTCIWCDNCAPCNQLWRDCQNKQVFSVLSLHSLGVSYNSPWWELHSQMLCWYGALLHSMRSPGDSRLRAWCLTGTSHSKLGLVWLLDM